MKLGLIQLILIIMFLQQTSELVFEKVSNSKFSNAEIVNNNILLSYDGGISKYSFDFKLISEIPIDDLKLDSYSKIHQINTNMIIIESSRYIYLIENDSIKYKITYDSISFFRQILIIDSNTFLVLKVELTTSIIYYCLYSIESNIPIKIEKASKGYNHYSCTLSSLSSNKYITCFLVDDTEIYYNIFDSNLNQIKSQTKIENLPENNMRTNYLYSLSITNTKLVLLLIKNNYDSDFLCKSYLVIFEFKQNLGSGTCQIDKISQNENFIVYEKTFIGYENFLLKKKNEEDFIVVFPIDNSKKNFYFSFFQYKDNILSIKEGYHNIPLSFQNEIQKLQFLIINSDFAISFYYFNNEEENEIKETYLSYLSTRKCSDFKIINYLENIKEIDFSQHIISELISPYPDIQKMKIDNINSPSISLFYDSNPYNKDQFYDYKKWSFKSGSESGNYEIQYSIYSSNDYSISNCKITLEILEENKDINKNNEDEIEANFIEEEIKSKIEDLKSNSFINFENNILYETEKYKINFYNTSENSQKTAIEKEGITNINLLGCEKILKTKYNIPDNEVLNILKVEIKRNDTISMQVEYEIFSENLQILNLSLCKDEIIRISIPYNLKNIRKNNFRKLSEEIDLEEKYKLGLKYDYDILNSNSPFYNDICTNFDSEYSSDLIIEDRKKYYYIPQLFCEETCIYSSYNITNQKVDCDCYAKTETKYNVFDRNFSNNTIDTTFNKKISNVNIKVFQCIGKGFKNITKNIGVWIILVIFIGFLILSFFAFLFDNNNKNKIKVKMDEEIPELGNHSFSDIDLTIIPYELALKNDKRKLHKMYFGIIKYNHLIFFTFITKGLEKNIFLKIMMLLFFIILLFLFNLFFFLDKDFTYIYLNEGKFNFGKLFPMALVASLITLLINMIIRLLLKEKEKKKVKHIKTISKISNNTVNKNEEEVILDISENKFNNRILLFSFVVIIFIIIIFFYLLSFGSIFINNQKYLLLRVLISFIINCILPFILCLIYSILRYFGLRAQIELLYKISLIIQNY